MKKSRGEESQIATGLRLYSRIPDKKGLSGPAYMKDSASKI